MGAIIQQMDRKENRYAVHRQFAEGLTTDRTSNRPLVQKTKVGWGGVGWVS